MITTPITINLFRQFLTWCRNLAPQHHQQRTDLPTLNRLLTGWWGCEHIDGVACLRVGSMWLCATADHLYRVAVVVGLLGLLWCGGDLDETETLIRRPRAEEVTRG